jgi:hypothetical protein
MYDEIESYFIFLNCWGEDQHFLSHLDPPIFIYIFRQFNSRNNLGTVNTFFGIIDLILLYA